MSGLTHSRLTGRGRARLGACAAVGGGLSVAGLGAQLSPSFGVGLAALGLMTLGAAFVVAEAHLGAGASTQMHDDANT